MKADALRIAMLQPIVELLVITEVEALLLKLPLQIPISFGDEDEIRMRFLYDGNQISPVLRCRPWTRAAAPGPLEDRVQQEHGHVAADSIALAGDTRNSFRRRLTEPRLKSI